MQRHSGTLLSNWSRSWFGWSGHCWQAGTAAAHLSPSTGIKGRRKQSLPGEKNPTQAESKACWKFLPWQSGGQGDFTVACRCVRVRRGLEHLPDGERQKTGSERED